MEDENYEEAKIMFINSINSYGTPLGWLGLGITCFRVGKIWNNRSNPYYLKFNIVFQSFQLGELDSAEACLNEANLLDNRSTKIWAYLALINLIQKNKQEFEQCIMEAKKVCLTFISHRATNKK